MTNIGEQLKKCRMDNGYSQEYVSEKLEISRQTLSNWENDRSQPTFGKFIELFKLYNIEIVIRD